MFLKVRFLAETIEASFHCPHGLTKSFTHLPSSRQTHRTKAITSSSSRLLPSKSAASVGHASSNSQSCFLSLWCHLAYLEDSNATGRYRRLSHCRFSDTTLYSQGNSESGIYAAEHSLLAGDSLCHPALRALRSTAL